MNSTQLYEFLLSTVALCKSLNRLDVAPQIQHLKVDFAPVVAFQTSPSIIVNVIECLTVTSGTLVGSKGLILFPM